MVAPDHLAMSFTSYAQNFEDIMLWRALQHIHGGFYVDIGAQHPVVDSVSKGFYEKGWRGVHVEPVPVWAQMLREDRPDETVLEIAVSDRAGTLELNIIPDTGLSTTVRAIADRHRQMAGWVSNVRRVPCLPLNAALEDLVGARDVHWLKIDVEGAEHDVLNGWSPDALRPWIMVIEATEPLSDRPSYINWEPLVLQAGYKFVYFDGLNRFYVAQERQTLASAFSRPPNVFDIIDGVRLSGTSPWCSAVNERHQQAEAKAEQAEAKAEQAEAKAEQAEAKAEQAEAASNQHLTQLDAILASRSWRVTAPLRQTSRFVRWFVYGSVAWLTLQPGSRPRRVARSGLIWAINKVSAHPILKTRALRVLNKFPSLEQRLRRINFAQSSVSSASQTLSSPSGRHEDTVILSPRARQIYSDINEAIKKRDGESV